MHAVNFQNGFYKIHKLLNFIQYDIFLNNRIHPGKITSKYFWLKNSLSSVQKQKQPEFCLETETSLSSVYKQETAWVLFRNRKQPEFCLETGNSLSSAKKQETAWVLLRNKKQPEFCLETENSLNSVAGNSLTSVKNRKQPELCL